MVTNQVEKARLCRVNWWAGQAKKGAGEIFPNVNGEKVSGLLPESTKKVQRKQCDQMLKEKVAQILDDGERFECPQANVVNKLQSSTTTLQ